MDYIDQRIVRVKIAGKGHGIIAQKKIPVNTLIIRETAAFQLGPNEKIYSDIFQLLYQIFTSDSPKKIKQFQNFVPKNTKSYQHYREKIEKELTKLKNTEQHHIYTFFKENYTDNEILLFCAKYMANAFEPGVVLIKGAMLNHSCSPNVIFNWEKRSASDKKENIMNFTTVRDIEAGEEICGNYVDIRLDNEARQKRLLDQYGFHCRCVRCSHESNITL